MAFQEADHRQRYNSRNEGTPFSAPLRNFIRESKMKQTFYTNCEGYYDRRKLTGKDMLREFINNSVYMTEDSFFTGRKFYDNIMVKVLAEKIVSRSKTYERSGEIHIFVVWVYYFDYSNSDMNTTPVFKIFITEDENETEFMDISGRFYKSWDHYLDNARFPRSFLCVPRNGKYTFVDGTLDLEFLCAKAFANQSTDAAPFCERIVRPCIQKIKTFGGRMLEDFKKMVHILLHYFQQYKIADVCITVGVPIMGAIFVRKSGGNLTEYESTVNTVGRMLFNITRDWKTSNLLGSGRSELGLPAGNVLSASSDLHSRDEVAKFIEHCKSPKKNWREILKFFCSLFRKCWSVLIELLSVLPCCPMLSNLSKFLLVVDSCAKVSEKLLENVGDVCGISNSAANSRELTKASNSHSDSQLVGLPPSKGETKVSSSEIVSRCELPDPEKVWKVTLNHLNSLGKVSPMQNRIDFQELQCVPNTCNIYLIGTVEDKVIFACVKMSLSYFAKNLRAAFPRARRINAVSPEHIDVMDSEEKVLASLFFPKDDIAIGISDRNAISPQAHNFFFAS